MYSKHNELVSPINQVKMSPSVDKLIKISLQRHKDIPQRLCLYHYHKYKNNNNILKIQRTVEHGAQTTKEAAASNERGL